MLLLEAVINRGLLHRLRQDIHLIARCHPLKGLPTSAPKRETLVVGGIEVHIPVDILEPIAFECVQLLDGYVANVRPGSVLESVIVEELGAKE